MSRLAETSKYDSLLHDGIKVVIAGAPNAGKSSLMNALLGRERAIVSPTAGTTRDFIDDRMMLGEFVLNLTDTAGLRRDAEDIEEEEFAALRKNRRFRHLSACSRFRRRRPRVHAPNS